MRALLDREHVPVDAFKDVDTSTTAPVNNDVLTWSSANGTWQPAVAPGAGGGEANTGSNQGTDGVGVYDTKVGVDLQFRNIAPASSKVTVSLNTKDIDIDVVDANLTPTTTNINGSNWVVLYTDGSGNVTELALGASSTVLTSNGVSSAPSWQAAGGVTSIDDLSDVDTTTNAPNIGDDLVWDGTNWVTNMTQLIKEVDFDGDFIYIGEAQPGTATSTAAWRVKRTEFTGDDSETLYADGNVNFDNTWTGRLGFSYS